MNSQISFNSLLVPTDFSDNAWIAFEYARRLTDRDESEIVVMHAIDPTIIDQMVELGAADHEATSGNLRKQRTSIELCLVCLRVAGVGPAELCAIECAIEDLIGPRPIRKGHGEPVVDPHVAHPRGPLVIGEIGVLKLGNKGAPGRDDLGILLGVGGLVLL